MGILVIPFIFLEPSSKIVVEARNYRDQIFLVCREFLNGHNIFNFLGQAFVKLRHFSSFVLCHS
jgi:hypothetical protein